MQTTTILDEKIFWTKVREARNRLLALDYDGTLAPFHMDRSKAKPFEGMVDLLQEIRDSKKTTLAIISGRPVSGVIYLMGDLNVITVGCHGAEILIPESEKCHFPNHLSSNTQVQKGHPFTPKTQNTGEGEDSPSTTFLYKLSPGQKNRLKRAEEETIVCAGSSLQDRIEWKPTSIAFHTRGLDPLLAKQLENSIFHLWSRDSKKTGLECRYFNGGVELRAVGINKGNAIKWLIENQPTNALTIYLGDDETDEDAFRVIKERGGLGIKVGMPNNKTAAIGFLPDIKGVFNFLKEWVNVTINK